MSAASKAFKVTSSIVSLSSLLVVLISGASLFWWLNQSETQADRFLRSTILDANGGAPEWQLIEQKFPFRILKITDLESNKVVLEYDHSNSTEQLFFTIESLILPEPTQEVIHGYNISFRVDHRPIIQMTVTATGATLILLLLIAIIAGRSSAASVKKQINRDTAKLKKVLHAIASKKRVQDGALQLGVDHEAIKEVVAEIENNLLNELEETSNYASSLEHQAFHDSLTGFANKAKFKRDFASKLELKGNTHYGLLAIVRAACLQEINERSGYGAGDDYIRQLAEILQTIAAHFQRPNMYRLNSGDLALSLDLAPKGEHEKLGSQLKNLCNDLARQLNIDEVATIGITTYQSGDEVGELLSRCDNALSMARNRSGNHWHYSETVMESSLQGRMQWRALVTQVIEKSSVSLVQQPQMALSDSAIVYSELQARFYDENSKPISTASMLAEAQSNNLIIRLDKTIVEHALKTLAKSARFNSYYAINLSNTSIGDSHFCIWLERQLLRDPAITRNLVFEVSEHGITSDMEAGRRIIDIIHRVGARFTIEHFGTSVLSLKSFRELNPDYVKLDASHTVDIVEDKRLQYFVRTLVDITHQMGIKVIAEAVETVEQKQLLEALKIDIIQGYFVGKPVPIGQADSSETDDDPDIMNIELGLN